MATHKSVGVSIMKKLLIGLTVLLVHTAAHAQQIAPAGPEALPPPPPTPAPAPAPAPSTQEMPPAYAPPPGYVVPVPPPTYGAPPAYGPPPVYPPPVYRPYYRYAPPPPYRYAPAPYYTYPTPQRDVLNRPFTLGGGIGFGGLIFDDQNNSNNRGVHRDGLSYTFRLGFGLRPGLLLLWDVEGTAANYGSSSVMQTANLVALQIFCHPTLLHQGWLRIRGLQSGQPGDPVGRGGDGGHGYELVQAWNWSFDIEATITGAHLNSNGTDQNWSNWSLLNFALNFY